MDFSFTDEQNQLRDSLGKFLAAEYEFDKRRAMLAAPEGWRRNWAAFAELGLLAAPLPEAHGGLGGGPSDVLVVMEEFGKALVVEPFVQSVVLAGGLIARAGNAAQQAEILPAIASGERIVALAHAEPRSRYNLAAVETSARKDGAGYVLNGHKAVVIGGPQAECFIVVARTAGATRDEKGISLFVAAKSAKGVSTRDYSTVDGFRASELYLENVSVAADALIGPADGALPLLQEAADHAIAALCAEAAGAMRVAHALTLDYAKTRKQFGVAIGSFQVIQHRLADMFMSVEQAVSMAYLATIKLDAPALERTKAASAAKAKIGREARFLGQAAVQIHGGMGVTDEMRVAHYFKRLTIIENLFGTSDHHARRYAALSFAA